MENEIKLVSGAMVTLSLATAAMIVVPFLQLKDVPPPPALKPYTSQELRGRQVYMANGCIACHTQQPSSTGAGIADAARGWGRPSVAGDYHYDQPPLLGTMRTGPDLFNIGVRQPSADWHLGHLFQPRAYVAGSTMPAYGFLFEVKDEAAVVKGERVVVLPPGTVPAGKAVVAKPEALDLVAYLQGLKREYPVLTPAQAEAAARLLPGEAKPAGAAPAPSNADDRGGSDAAPETNS
ncbi:cbb3-type cytochrome c oxidase subunit II [Ramlibacter tataouinensis]|uniref:cbb3-type cytochrome c oxidase subunit II n=1 Tax=Ramlibacter tataouinensis TaxID=94132 RepID=UPI0022F3A295|nr:cbb3-type cytochrome c oxidase subunit II [Ramlibacter tataouinensis]WBY02663.1 cbb3-type cytochrome c oxidase subunit II [Ramlibacter tataouinensis]